MHKFLGLILSAFFLNPLVKAESLVIEQVTVLTPTSKNQVDSLSNQWVLIRDERIEKVSSTPITPPKNSRYIDGKGKYLIPGLMDSHVHTQTMPGLNWADPNVDKLQNTFKQQQPRSFLYHGVTQILDLALSRRAADEFNISSIKPDLFFCGAAPIVGGYNLLDANLSDAIQRRPYFIHRPEVDGALPNGFDPSQRTPEAVVTRIKADRASCIKVFIEDGFDMDSSWPMIDTALLKRVRKAADQHDLLMVAHANALDMQHIAIETKVDVMAHGLWNWLELHGNDGLPTPIQEIADRIVANKIHYQPTLNVMRSLRDVLVENHLSLAAYQNLVPKKTLDWYKTYAGQWFAREMQMGWGTHDLQKIQDRQTRVLKQGERVLSYLYKKGHPILLATDTPPAPTYASQPGISALTELKAMHNAGIDLSSLLAAATLNNAKAFKIDNNYGTIESGKYANLLLLTNNPLNDVDAYDSIEKILIRGQVIERNTLKVVNH